MKKHFLQKSKNLTLALALLALAPSSMVLHAMNAPKKLNQDSQLSRILSDILAEDKATREEIHTAVKAIADDLAQTGRGYQVIAQKIKSILSKLDNNKQPNELTPQTALVECLMLLIEKKHPELFNDWCDQRLKVLANEEFMIKLRKKNQDKLPEIKTKREALKTINLFIAME